MISLKTRMVIHGDLASYDQALAQVNTGAVRGTVNRIRTQGRKQIRSAGLGRLEKTWRGIVTGEGGKLITKRGYALDPRGRVYSTAGVKGRVDDLLDLFEQGLVMVPGHGLYFAIPTPQAGGRNAVPANRQPRNKFYFVEIGARGKRKRRGRAKRAVLVHRELHEVWFILVPRVRLKRRLRLRPLVERQVLRLPEDYDRRWARAVAKLEKKVS